MKICEYCGRVHQVAYPDVRFCSLLCRVHYEQHPLGYGPVDWTEEQRQQAKFLGDYHVVLAQGAARLLQQTQGQSPEQQVGPLRNWITQAVAQESILSEITDFFKAPPSTAPTE